MADVKTLEDKFSREELNEFAASKGVESPEKLGSKTEVAEKLSPLVTPEEVEVFENRNNDGDSSDDGDKTDAEKTSDVSNSDSSEQFDDAAQVGHDTAKKNVESEASENTNEPGADNVEFKPKTSDAEPGLKKKGDKQPRTDVLGDDEAAQEPDYGIKQGQATAKKNAKKNPDRNLTALEDAAEVGRKTAEKNLATEKKLANRSKKEHNNGIANKGDI